MIRPARMMKNRFPVIKYPTIAKIDGVQTVVSLNIKNLTPLTTNGDNYSPVEYNIEAATQNDMIFPSLDPAIWEVRYPDKDIKGNVI